MVKKTYKKLKMKIDLTNIENSDIKYTISKFPDGQQNITIYDFCDLDLSFDNDEVIIKSRMSSFCDLELIIATNQALKEQGHKNIHLYTPYFLGARSDRKFIDGQTNYLKNVICPIINSQNFQTVTVFDPHSDVLEACLNNFKKISNVSFVKDIIYFVRNDGSNRVDDNITLISPDAGALKKVYDVAKACNIKNVIVANKLRNLETGQIIRTEVPNLDQEPGEKHFIIVDDICDGGRTFIEIAKAIREVRSKSIFNDKLTLIISHGIFSGGFGELYKYFNNIYSTNSYSDSIGVTQSDIFK